MKKIISGMVAICMLLFLFTGCDKIKEKTASANAEIQKTKLTFIYPRDGSGTVKKLIADYQQKHENIEIISDEAPGNKSGYFEKLSAFAATGRMFPDIMVIHDSWAAYFAGRGYIKPLDGGLTANKREEFFPGMINAVTWKDKVYGLPFWQDTLLLYYRKDLVGTPPSSWSELEQSADSISKAYEMPNGLIFPAASKENAGAFIASLLMSYGAYPDFRAQEPLLDSDSAALAFNRLKSMVSNGVIIDGVLKMGAEDCRAAFEKGGAPYMINWSYANRLFSMETSLLYDKVGVMPIPSGQPGVVDDSILSGWVMVMGMNTKNIPEAWSFMEYMTDAESQLRLASDGGIVPSRKSLFSEDSWRKQIGIPSVAFDVLSSGSTLMTGQNFEIQTNALAEIAVQAIGQNKLTSSLVSILRDGIAAGINPGENATDNTGDNTADDTADDTADNEDSSDGSTDSGDSSSGDPVSD